jgi:hypothetical protein
MRRAMEKDNIQNQNLLIKHSTAFEDSVREERGCK